MRCDSAGLPIASTDPLGGTVHYRRDAFGRVVEMQDQAGGVTRFAWNVEGRLLSIVAPDGGRTDFAYDAEGNRVVARDAAGNVTAIEYTHFDLPAARIDPDGARYEFGYDTELRLVSVVNPLGLRWAYEYDEAGNLAQECDFDGRVLRYRYDAAGRMVARSTPSGRTVEYTLDEQGRVVAQRVGEQLETFTYDEAGRLATAHNADAELVLEYDRAGNIVAESVNGRVVTHTYDAAGRRTRRTTPGGAITQWTYDALDAPISLATQAGAFAFEHDALSREVVRRVGPEASITQSWDSNSRLTGTAVWRQPTAAAGMAAASPSEPALVQQHAYAYRPDGLPLAMADQFEGEQVLELDPVGRVGARRAAQWNESYTYDAAGNITSRGGSGDAATGDAGEGPWEYRALQIRRAGRTSYEYDEDGRLLLSTRRTLSGRRLTWRYTWDGFDRLISAETPDGAVWRYRYDPLGRRIAKQHRDTDGTVLGEVLFSWDDTRLAEQLVTEHGIPGATATTWDYRPGTDEPLAQSVARLPADAADQAEIDRRFYAIVTDLVGTPRELLTTDGTIAWRTVADLWGRIRFQPEGEADCPLRFPGQYHDLETGLHYNLLRYYDPEVGRYITPDPLGLEPAANHRAYVLNPLAWIDPLGLASCLKITDHTWDHIFKGEINKRGAAVGYHYRPDGQDRYGVRTTKKGALDENGLYKGTVTQRVWDGNTWVEKRAESTFFPNNWSEDQVRHAVTRAVSEGNIIKDKEGNPTNAWQGTYRGITIRGYYDPVTKHVTTAYPVHNDDR